MNHIIGYNVEDDIIWHFIFLEQVILRKSQRVIFDSQRPASFTINVAMFHFVWAKRCDMWRAVDLKCHCCVNAAGCKSSVGSRCQHHCISVRQQASRCSCAIGFTLNDDQRSCDTSQWTFLPTTFSGQDRALGPCLCLDSDLKKLNGLWRGHLACWFTLTLSRPVKGSRSYINFMVTGGKCSFFDFECSQLIEKWNWRWENQLWHSAGNTGGR